MLSFAVNCSSSQRISSYSCRIRHLMYGTHLQHERFKPLLYGAPKMFAGDAAEADGQGERLVDVCPDQLCHESSNARQASVLHLRADIRMSRSELGLHSQQHANTRDTKSGW